MDPVHMEDEVQLTHVLKAVVQGLHKHLDTERQGMREGGREGDKRRGRAEVQRGRGGQGQREGEVSGAEIRPPPAAVHLDEVKDAKLTLIGVNTEHEVEGGIMAVDQPPVTSTKCAGQGVEEGR